MVTIAVGIVLFAGHTAGAQVSELSEYAFVAGIGTEYDMSSGSTTLLGSNTDDGLSDPTDIGFSFSLGGSAYTQFRANSNGYMTLGSDATSSGCCGAAITGLPGSDGSARPAVVPFSEDLHNGSDGYVSYKLFGSSPNRILVVHWQTRQFPGAGETTHTTMQVRLYESSNTIELWYGESELTNSDPGGIGVIAGSSNYASVNSGAVSYSSAETSTFPDAGTMYSFTPCQSNVAFIGNTDQGGTTNMADGDFLLEDFHVMRGSSGGQMPFTIFNGDRTLDACETRSYSYSIGGPHGGDYSISPANGVLVNGTSGMPVITFTPGGTGVREATLTVSDDAGLSREFKLMASGDTRIRWSGDIAEGGTTNVEDRDTVLNGVRVKFDSSKTFRPIIIENINSDPLETPPASITYELIDPLGNYAINMVADQLNGGERSILEITFTGEGVVGIQEAMLIVTADGETRTYFLRAFNAAAGGRLFAEGSEVTAGNPLFVERYACVGDGIVTLEVRAVNTGAGDFVIRGAEFYATDTLITQGKPRYPLRRDRFSNLMEMGGYFVSNAPGVVPRKANSQFDSIVIPEGQARLFYLNMIPARPGKQFGRVYFHTNAFNMEDPNVDGVPTRGILQAGVFGRGLGSFLNGSEHLNRPAPIVFPVTALRKTSVGQAVIANEGNCDLRISRSALRLQAGDLKDFTLLSVLPNTAIDGDDYLLPPGFADTITVQFGPQMYGSRRATIRLITNDSTLDDGTITEHGAFYLDVFGTGGTGLLTRGTTLPPSVADSDDEFGYGFVELENTSTRSITIRSIALEEVFPYQFSEFIEDPAHKWPSLPYILGPGETLRLWVGLDPGLAGEGERLGEVVLIINDGDEVRVPVSGSIRARVLQASTIFVQGSGEVETELGELARHPLIVYNTGTLPVRVEDPVVVSGNEEFFVTSFDRHVIEPGQYEILEITYIPQALGLSQGRILIRNNSPYGGGMYNFNVYARCVEATGTVVGGGASGSGAALQEQGESAAKPRDAVSLQLSTVMPNPASGVTTVEFVVSEIGTANLSLYDESGRLVNVVATDDELKANRQVSVDVTGLPSGLYHLMLQQGETMVSRPLQVVR